MELYARLQIGWINNEKDLVLCESFTSNSSSHQHLRYEECIYNNCIDVSAKWLERRMKSTLPELIPIVSSVYFTDAIRMENVTSSFNTRGFSLANDRGGK